MPGAHSTSPLCAGRRPRDLKPEVCWQLPLRREDHVDDENGHVTSTVRQWDRRHWGKGGLEFHWWCTEAPDAFVGKHPVYEEMEGELTEMIGSKVYKQMVAALRERDRLRGRRCPSPIPPCGSADGRGQPRRPDQGSAETFRSRDDDAPAPGWLKLDPGSTKSRLGQEPIGRQSLSGSSSACEWTSGWSPGCGRTGLLRPCTTKRGRRLARPRTQRTALRTLSMIVSDFALPRSADGVPFSRELLVKPGPQQSVPRPTARPLRRIRPLTHCSGLAAAWRPFPGHRPGAAVPSPYVKGCTRSFPTRLPSETGRAPMPPPTSRPTRDGRTLRSAGHPWDETHLGRYRPAAGGRSLGHLRWPACRPPDSTHTRWWSDSVSGPRP